MSNPVDQDFADLYGDDEAYIGPETGENMDVS